MRGFGLDDRPGGGGLQVSEGRRREVLGVGLPGRRVEVPPQVLPPGVSAISPVTGRLHGPTSARVPAGAVEEGLDGSMRRSGPSTILPFLVPDIAGGD